MAKKEQGAKEDRTEVGAERAEFKEATGGDHGDEVYVNVG